MKLLNENLEHDVTTSILNEAEATPMWTNYMEAFNSFMQQGTKRFERYVAYEEMDNYPEINLAMEIISTEIFSFEPISNTPFEIDTEGKIPETTLSTLIYQFTEILNLHEILPSAVRNSLKYGDAFYFVLKTADDKLTGLRKIENKDIEFIEYDEVGAKPLNYYIKKSTIEDNNMHNYLSFLKFQNLEVAVTNQKVSLLNKEGDDYYIIPSNRIARFMNKGQDSKFFPFGESYLETIFPYWKKVTLLEDSLIIYRIVRAPERRVFYIDVGKAPAKIAEKVVTQTKDEIKRRRTAATQESGEMGITSTFNPLSMQEDYFFAQRADGRGSRVETLPGACLSLDTKIPLLDGRELTLQNIINEWGNNKDKENWVYSCNPITGELAPGKITWAGVTRKNTKVLKITLDNGEEITCTPDHKFPIRDIGFVEAKDLKEGQSLIPFRKRLEKISKNRNEYEQVFDVSKNDWVFTHRFVAKFFKDQVLVYEKDEVKNVIHHQNVNRFDNTPNNLVWMNSKDHFKFHSYLKQEDWNGMDIGKYEWIKKRMSDGLAEKRKDIDYNKKYIEKQTINAIKGSKTRIDKQENDLEFKKKVYKKSGESLSTRIKTDIDYQKKLIRHLKDIQQPWKNIKTVFDRVLLEKIIHIINEYNINQKKELLIFLSNDTDFMSYFQELNKFEGGVDKRKLDSFCNQHMDKLLKQFNYNSWKDFILKIPVYNHKIVKIEVMDYCMDVGTITVDGTEELHNYHTFALSSGVFTKNSNLGEIADVNYFYKKLLASLRVPPSYFNTENPATWNDGKVGSALAEEARFGKWLSKIRHQFTESFRELFIIFLEERGLKLKPDELKLRWRESINVNENQELEKMIQRQSVFTGFPMEQFSPFYLQKKVLGWSEEEVQENITQLKKWTKLNTELTESKIE